MVVIYFSLMALESCSFAAAVLLPICLIVTS